MGPYVVGIITARGGSKSIPRKNLVPLGGKPLIAWTIEAALKSRRLGRVILSTDNEEIADVSRAWGAEVPFLRPEELARDDSPHVSVLVHAVRWLETEEGPRQEYVMLLQPTSPFRTSYDIDAAIDLAVDRDADAVLGVCMAQEHPYLAKTVTEDGRLQDFMPTPRGYLRRQILSPVYHLNGAIYLVRRPVLLERETWCTERTYAYVMPPERSLDIDSPLDLRLAESLVRYGSEVQRN